MCIKIITAEKGFVKLEAIPGPHHLNAMGVVQGGVTASILDAATGCAIQTLLETGMRFATMDLNVKYIKPVQADGSILFAEGRTLHVSNRIGMAEGTLKNKNGKLYACASATCMIFKKNSRSEITALEFTN
ncbi:PaaI family thioesterase [Desulfobacula sp.]|uniref:PaaI family thioesterase n=1 Tax=Desulfobacula sp. TaxID=2593537 RepID=UPI00261C3750|nr:PaaI family thioesterase [Desulfobacula sp.]